MTAPLDRLHRKARALAERQLDGDEEVVTAVPGRSKQAMVVTDRRILMLKPGLMAGAWLGPKAASFPLSTINAINVHTGPRIAALELVVIGSEAPAKADLTTAFQSPNWLPCQASVGSSPMIGELRAFVESNGRSRSARAELRAYEGA